MKKLSLIGALLSLVLAIGITVGAYFIIKSIPPEDGIERLSLIVFLPLLIVMGIVQIGALTGGIVSTVKCATCGSLTLTIIFSVVFVTYLGIITLNASQIVTLIQIL